MSIEIQELRAFKVDAVLSHGVQPGQVFDASRRASAELRSECSRIWVRLLIIRLR